MSDLYNRIEILCKEKKISITTMCKESGASRASLSDLKVGRKQSLSADTLSKIAHYFSVSVDFLLTGKASYKPIPSSDEENPWEIELLDAFDELDLGKQIEAVAHVQNLANGTETKKSPTESGERCTDCDDNRNTVRIAGRNGHYEERVLTDEQFAALKAILDQMPDASDDL